MYFPSPCEEDGTSRGAQLLGRHLSGVPASVTQQHGRSRAKTNTWVTSQAGQGSAGWRGQHRGFWRNFLFQERHKLLHTLPDLSACEHCPSPGDEHA